MSVTSQTSHWLHAAWHSAIDFCFPSLCAWCERAEGTGGTDSLLCPDCQRECQDCSGTQCPRCSASVGPFVDLSQGCVFCRNERFAFESVCSIGPYRGSLRSACLRAKSQSGLPLSRALTRELLKLRKEQMGEWKIDLVVPVPHHWWEQLRRSHRSPSTIAETLAMSLRVPTRFDLLHKKRLTPKQALLPVTRRKANLRGAFQIGGRADLDGATVLLVDDILTTGTTAHECSKVLKQAGAARVHVAVLARVANP